MSGRCRLALALSLAIAAAPAVAAPTDLIKCDGYGGRRSSGEGVARAALIIATGGLFGSPEVDRPGARLSGREGAAACQAALGDERVTNNAVRRAEVMLALAIDQLEAGDSAVAVHNAQGARSTGISAAKQGAFDRTVGASSLLVEAYAQFALGRQEEAEALAAKAIAARPYGVLINDLALQIMAQTPAISALEAAALDRRVRIDRPGLWTRAQRRIAAGDWRGAVADIRMGVAMAAPQKPDLTAEATLAVVLAIAGNGAEAETVLAGYRQHSDLVVAANANAEETLELSRADELVRLCRIMLMLNKGDLAAARAALEAQPRWLVAPQLVVPVIEAARAKGIAVEDPARLLVNYAATARTTLTSTDLARGLMKRLPRWEDEDVWRNAAKAASTQVATNLDTRPRDLAGLWSTYWVPGEYLPTRSARRRSSRPRAASASSDRTGSSSSTARAAGTARTRRRWRGPASSSIHRPMRGYSRVIRTGRSRHRACSWSPMSNGISARSTPSRCRSPGTRCDRHPVAVGRGLRNRAGRSRQDLDTSP